jgi:hypothetical protein
MKQTILNPYYARPEAADAECLGKFVMRWAFFGVLMWWIWSWLGWSHAIVWVIGLGLAFSMVRKEFGE